MGGNGAGARTTHEKPRKSYRRDMKDQGDSGETRNECRQESVRSGGVYPVRLSEEYKSSRGKHKVLRDRIRIVERV